MIALLALIIVWALGSRFIMQAIDVHAEQRRLHLSFVNRLYIALLWPFIEAWEFIEELTEYK